METELKIIKRKDGTFTGSDGEPVEYYWYKGLRTADQVTIDFGSRNGGYEEGETVSILLEKTENPKGGFRYKEIS